MMIHDRDVELPSALSGWGSHRESPGREEPQRFSIKQQFSGAHVFLTGCTGYIGGLVLESILRTTSVTRVFVLLRSKRGEPAQARCDKLLQGPMFHLVRDRPDLVSKVTAVAGDLSEPGLGLSAPDAEALAGCVDILIHSAADIRLEAPIQETMRANYVGTERVLALALTLRRRVPLGRGAPYKPGAALRSMVHVSTAYVNINHAPGTTVHERFYPIMQGEVEIDGEMVAEELLSLPKLDADRRADFYTHLWGFPNTYCLGKHLAEQMVARTHRKTGLPLAILRPSLVTGVAGLPWPGYVGNWAGPSGMGAAIAIGFFPSVTAYALNPYSTWDVVPGDLAASAILATAAAVACGLQSEIASLTGSGTWMGTGAGANRICGAGPTGAAAAEALLPSPLAMLAAGKKPFARKMSMLSTFTDDTALALIGAGSAAGVNSPGGSTGSRGASPSALSGASDEACELSSDDAEHAAAAAAAAAAANCGAPGAPPPASPAPAKGAPPPLGGGARARPPQPLLIVHAATSTTYPSNVYEAYNVTADFLRAHPSPISINVGSTRGQQWMGPGWLPSQSAVAFWRFYNWVKVVIVCFLLRLFGMEKAAKKLSVGYQQWAMNNNPKNDTQLLFANPTLQQLHARLEPQERLDYLLTFRPPRRRAGERENGAGGGGAEEEPEHPGATLGWYDYSCNCLAGIFRSLTGVTPPEEAPVPGKPGVVVRHSYRHIK
ncbi:MAG: male sterility protein-domain-containing protein [Monoraphidium minutum]|nr:MAG: male sterility protein-domain-containing protein [Monoraphidium minutum]